MSDVRRDDVVLEVRDLSVEFLVEGDWVTVVDRVDLDVESHSTLGLVGESGSGKTVTSLALMGLLPREGARLRGSIKFKGRELVGMPERQLQSLRGGQMGMVFQEPRRSLDPAFTVGDQIAEVVRRHSGQSKKAAWASAVQILERVGIAEPERRSHAYPHEFSGGMCQRVMLAIALVSRPALLIADEPTTALDVTVQKDVLNLMNELQAEMGLSILFITHDLGVVAQMCDDVNVMYAGQVVERTTLTELFEHPRHPYSRGLLDAIPDAVPPGERLRSIPGSVPAPRDWPRSCRFFDRCGHAIAGRCDEAEIALEPVALNTAARCIRAHELLSREASDERAS